MPCIEWSRFRQSQSTVRGDDDARLATKDGSYCINHVLAAAEQSSDSAQSADESVFRLDTGLVGHLATGYIQGLLDGGTRSQRRQHRWGWLRPFEHLHHTVLRRSMRRGGRNRNVCCVSLGLFGLRRSSLLRVLGKPARLHRYG